MRALFQGKVRVHLQTGSRVFSVPDNTPEGYSVQLHNDFGIWVEGAEQLATKSFDVPVKLEVVDNPLDGAKRQVAEDCPSCGEPPPYTSPCPTCEPTEQAEDGKKTFWAQVRDFFHWYMS